MSIDFESVGVEEALSAVDVILVMSDISVDEPLVVKTRPHLGLQTFTGTVEEVLFAADVSGDGVVWGSGTYPVPRPGDRFRAFAEAVRDNPASVPASDVGHLLQGEPVESLLVAASYVDETHFPDDYPAAWVAVVARPDETGRLVFGPETGSILEGVLPAVRAGATLRGASDRNDIETLVAWTRELTAHRVRGSGLMQRAPDSAGPHVAAWREMVRLSTADIDTLWLNADPTVRALDPDITPAAIFRELVEKPLFVDVADDAMVALGDYDLVIRTPTGVSDVAELSVGDHPGQVFAKPGETIEVVVTDDYLSGTGRVVATLASSEWDKAAGIMVEIRSSLTAVLSGTQYQPDYVVVSAVDEETLRAKIAEHAQEHGEVPTRP